MSKQAWAGLGDAITAIRRELSQAIADGEDNELKFRSGPVELELVATIHTDAEGRVKVLLLPWSAEAKLDHASDRTQRIKLTLQPIDPASGREQEISGQTPDRPR